MGADQSSPTATSALLPNYLTDYLHLDFTSMGFVMSGIGFGASLGTVLMPWVSDWIGRKPVMLISTAASFVSLLAFMAIGDRPGLLFMALFAAHFFNFACLSLTVGTLSAESVPVKLMATATGVAIAVGALFGGGVAPVLAGYVAEHFGIQYILDLAAAAMAIGFLNSMFLIETAPRRIKGGRTASAAQVARPSYAWPGSNEASTLLAYCSSVEEPSWSGSGMSTYLQDRQEIADLMVGWIHRDLAAWDRLRELFHPDGTIEVTWFDGKFSEFVDASMRMGTSDLRTKHVIGMPAVTFNGDKAVVETNAIIVGENVRIGLGCEAHNRFYDLVEKRHGAWRIVRRQSIYDMGSFTFPRGVLDVDPEIIGRYPREYAPLAYVLEQSGFPVKRIYATKGSGLESEMKAGGQAWLQN